MIFNDNKIINSLWIGEHLSKIEQLTIKSFLHHGHEFHLWLYEPLKSPVPDGVVIKDAGEIIPIEEVFRKKNADPINGGVGKGSFGSPFSDLFRYKLLFEEGGWWTDMDVTCLKPFDIDEPYFFREHPTLELIGNVMKCPKGSQAMMQVYEQVKNECDENTEDWLKPNKILNEIIQKEGLMKYKKENIGNMDLWPELHNYLNKNIPVPDNFWLLHWMNEEWRVRGLDKDVILSNSTLGRLMTKHGIEVPKTKWVDKIRNKVRSYVHLSSLT